MRGPERPSPPTVNPAIGESGDHARRRSGRRDRRTPWRRTEGPGVRSVAQDDRSRSGARSCGAWASLVLARLPQLSLLETVDTWQRRCSIWRRSSCRWRHKSFQRSTRAPRRRSPVALRRAGPTPSSSRWQERARRPVAATRPVEPSVSLGDVEGRAGALAAGCCVILKPASQTPLSALEMGRDRARRAGLLPARCKSFRARAPERAWRWCGTPVWTRSPSPAARRCGERLSSGEAAASLKGLSRARREVAQHRVRRCGPRGGGPRRVQRDLHKQRERCAPRARRSLRRDIDPCIARSPSLAERARCDRPRRPSGENDADGPRGLPLRPGRTPCSATSRTATAGTASPARRRRPQRATGGQRAWKGYFVRPTVFDAVTPEMRESPVRRSSGPVLAVLPFDDAADA